MILLDLFCGAGGCSVGYHRAGFDVIGVDNRPQKRYPFPFLQEDAIETLRNLCAGKSLVFGTHRIRLNDIAAIHASPPCQAFSSGTNLQRMRGNATDHPDLIEPTRRLLNDSGRPWIIENVPGAPLARGAIMLCGLTFNLKVFRHRFFESSVMLRAPEHIPHGSRRIGKDGFVCVAGKGGSLTSRTTSDYCRKAAWAAAMGIDWMSKKELAQAIPPAYTEYLGRQLLNALIREHA